MKTATQAKLTRDIEYQLEEQWVEVPRGTVVNYNEELQAAYVANENELFHCTPEMIEPFTPSLTLIPRAAELAAAK